MTVDPRDLRPAPSAQPGSIPLEQSPPAPARRPRVVIVGAGFGGLAAATALKGAPVEVTVIDRHNYHLFQPLLYQVATAALSPADIAQPIRAILSRQRNALVLLGRVTGVDTRAREVLIGARRIPYDQLAIATGARHAYSATTSGSPLRPASRRSRTRPRSAGASCWPSRRPRPRAIRSGARAS